MDDLAYLKTRGWEPGTTANTVERRHEFNKVEITTIDDAVKQEKQAEAFAKAIPKRHIGAGWDGW